MEGSERELTSHLHLVPRLRMRGVGWGPAEDIVSTAMNLWHWNIIVCALHKILLRCSNQGGEKRNI